MIHRLSRQRCKPQAGQRFTVNGEDYQLEGKLGSGAAGIVRKARRLRDNLSYAVKFLAPDPKYIDLEVFDDVAARFRREGERAPFLEHESLVRIHAYVENENGQAFKSGSPQNPFIVMQAIRGRTLERYIRNRERLSNETGEPKAFSVDPERLRIAVQIARALEYLHGKRLVHRDVKPANVFLTLREGSSIGRTKLGDFGIMKWGDYQAKVSSGTLTATTQRGLGTLKYMSPEQAVRPKEVTVRSDIFSLGITFFELFTQQILASPHHVFEIHAARLSRGTTPSRFHEMGYRLLPGADAIGEMVLDMHLRGAQGRPSIERVRGRLEWALEQLTGEDE